MITNIGNWTSEKIVKATKLNDAKNLLSQSLHACVHEFLHTAQLMHLGAQTIQDVGDDNQEKAAQTSRFEVVVGNHINHEEECRSNDEFDNNNFTQLLTEFYLNCFSSDELPSIEKVLKYKKASVQHIVVYYCYLQPSRKQQLLRKKCIVAASTFIISFEGCYLLYLATSHLYLPSSMKSKLTTNSKEAQTNPETKQPIRLRHYGLGLLLLSLTQHVSFCNNGKHAIVCEASLGDNQNAFFFYKRLLFNEVNEHHFLVMHMNDRYPELAHHASNLKWLVLMHNSIAKTHTKVLYSDKKKLIDTVRAANFARDTVCGQNYMQSNYNDIIMAIKDQQQLIAKLLKMAPHIEIDDIKSTQK
jgi:hypothetical protein